MFQNFVESMKHRGMDTSRQKMTSESATAATKATDGKGQGRTTVLEVPGGPILQSVSVSGARIALQRFRCITETYVLV